MVKAIYVARCARGAKWDLFNLVHKLIYFFPFFLGSAVAWWTWSWKCRPTGGVSSCRHFWTSSHFLSSIFPIIKEDRVEGRAPRGVLHIHMRKKRWLCLSYLNMKFEFGLLLALILTFLTQISTLWSFEFEIEERRGNSKLPWFQLSSKVGRSSTLF